MTAHTAAFSASYGSADRASRVFASLAPEVGGVDDDRTSVRVTQDDDTVEVIVEAADLTALRAGTTSWSRLLTVAERVSAPGAQRF